MASKQPKKYLTTRQLRERWGDCSQMFIERKIWHDPNFPKPIRLGHQGGSTRGRIRLFAEDEIESYERGCVTGQRGSAA
jgi:hypothetical protein